MNKKRRLVIMVVVAAVLLFLAPSCTTPANRPPAITGLAAGSEWTAPLGSLQVTCTASDPDGDALSYEWSASGGSVTGTGAVANWIAPEEVGAYDITVVVTDNQGGGNTASIPLIASDGTPPTIQNLIVTAKEPKYLKTTSTGYKVGKTKEYYVECIASARGGELIYEWSCNGGEISGGGSQITWTAPDTSCDVTVIVKASDSAGNWVKKSVVFEVVSCSSCSFG